MLYEVITQLTTGQLLELWRDTKEGQALARLAMLDEISVGDNILQELEDTCARLIDLYLRQRLEELQEKAASGRISPEEKQQLLLLLTSRARKIRNNFV